MIRILALIPLLAACALDVPPEVAQGEITFGGQTYPMTSRGDLWFVRADEGRVPCRAATKEDCYWSLRAHLQAVGALDDLG